MARTPKARTGGKYQAVPAPASPAQPISYGQLSDADQSNLDRVEAGLDIDTKLSVLQYIREDTMSNGYSMSQNLNYKIENNLPLNANEKFVADHLDKAMHDLGSDVVLNRACHADLLESLGVKNYKNMTQSQLDSALNGITFTNKSYMSTASDIKKNPFISGAQSGGREVYMNIKAKSSTKVIQGNRKQAEIVLGKGQNFRITGARFDGTMAYPRVGGALPRVIIDVEIFD